MEKLKKFIKECHSIEDINILLEAEGRVQHIDFDRKKYEKELFENPARFYNIGKSFYGENNGLDENEYNKRIFQNAKYLYENAPLIFEFYDQLENGLIYQTKDLTNIHKHLVCFTKLGEKERCLKRHERQLRYEHEERILDEFDDKDLFNIGRVMQRNKFNNGKEYYEECIDFSKMLFIKYPLTFEFYDDLVNSYKKSKNSEMSSERSVINAMIFEKWYPTTIPFKENGKIDFDKFEDLWNEELYNRMDNNKKNVK